MLEARMHCLGRLDALGRGSGRRVVGAEMQGSGCRDAGWSERIRIGVRGRMRFRTLFCVEGKMADRWGSGSGLPGVVGVAGCGVGVFAIGVPFLRVGEDVGGDSFPFVVADDSFVIVTLPEMPVKRRPSILFYGADVFVGGHCFEPTNDVTQCRGTPVWVLGFNFRAGGWVR